MEPKMSGGMIFLTGMVLSSSDSSDYDRRVVILTRERGKITAFAHGARRQGSPLMGVTTPFCFGTFGLFEGRNAYRLSQAGITNFFSALRQDPVGVYYGFYFMELADYYARENLDAADMLNLIYLSLRALENEHLPDRLVRYIFEIRLLELNGEFPVETAQDPRLLESTRYTLSYILSAPLRSLFSFTVKEEVLDELGRLEDRIRRQTIDRKLKSLDILEMMI